LLSDFTTYPFDSERHARALARVNYLHSHYDISNDDMLYTLSVFITAPQRWIAKWEWRPLTELEIAVRIPLKRGRLLLIQPGMVDNVARNRIPNEN
jgi:hypothetical protein